MSITLGWVIITLFWAIIIMAYSYSNIRKKRISARKEADRIKNLPVLKIGQTWTMTPIDQGPWPKSRQLLPMAKIIDLKDGWVRYSMGGMWTDERKTEASFRNCYTHLVEGDMDV